MKRKTPILLREAGEDGDPATEIPEQIQTELDAMGGLDALSKPHPFTNRV